MPIRIYEIDERSIIPGGWGDYAHILQHGMACHSPRVDDLLALERTGPYIPPITFPGIGDIVLTSSAKELLQSSGLTGFGFQAVAKILTVELHWENWNLAAEEPAYYPDSGEPEDYILGQPNSPSASTALGDLWELVVPDTARILRNSQQRLRLDLSTWNGSDVFRGVGYAVALFTERAQHWFFEHWAPYVEFAQFTTT
jgi:hypothetical protein